jgi:hypothetical protein
MSNTIEFNEEKYYYREGVPFIGSTTRRGFRLLDHHTLATKFIAALNTDPAEPSVLLRPIKPSQVSVTNSDVIQIYTPDRADYPYFAYKSRALVKWGLFLFIHCLIFWLLSFKPPFWGELILEIGYLVLLYWGMGSFLQMAPHDRVILIIVIVTIATMIAFILNIVSNDVSINALNPFYLLFLGWAWLRPAFQSEYEKWVEYMLRALLNEYMREQRADLAYWDQNNIGPALMWIFNESEG